MNVRTLLETAAGLVVSLTWIVVLGVYADLPATIVTGVRSSGLTVHSGKFVALVLPAIATLTFGIAAYAVRSERFRVNLPLTLAEDQWPPVLAAGRTFTSIVGFAVPATLFLNVLAMVESTRTGRASGLFLYAYVPVALAALATIVIAARVRSQIKR